MASEHRTMLPAFRADPDLLELADREWMRDPASIPAIGVHTMGRFIYDGTTKAEFEDRALAHLQYVIGTKLRRGEAFAFTWREDPSTGEGRTSVWINPGSSLVYRFAGSRTPSINPVWIDALTVVAASPAGLHLVPEPAGKSTRAAAIEPTALPTA